MFKKLMVAGIFAGITACTTASDRRAMDILQSDLELRPLVSSAIVRTVSLPTYAAAEEISFETDAGFIVASSGVLWADDPQRAVTLAITRNMSEILNTRVGPDPWPFVGLPDVAIDIRVERMIAAADGTFQLTGQFYIGGDGINFPNSSTPFNINLPMPDQSITAISNAQAAALLKLSEDIARNIAR